jgi:hypothetical protein
VRRRKGEPADEESDRIVGRFRYGIQKRDILCPDRFDIVDESREKKSEQGEEKRKRKKKKSKKKTEKDKDNSIQKKRRFFDFTFHQRPMPL